MSQHHEREELTVDSEIAAVLNHARRRIVERQVADATYQAAREGPWWVACLILPPVLIGGTLF